MIVYIRQSICLLWCLTLCHYSFAQDRSQGHENTSTSWGVELEESKTFIQNKGQYNNRGFEGADQTLYAVNLGKVQIFFSKKGISYCFEKKIKNRDREEGSHEPKVKFYRDIIHTEWVGANKNTTIVPLDKTSDYYSYAYKDHDDVKNVNHVSGYKKIVYKELYPKIDVEYVFHPVEGLKYSLILHPGADPSQIKIKYHTAHSNTKKESTTIQLNQRGQLEIKTSLGDLIEHKPYSFFADTKTEIKTNYLFKDNVLAFELGKYDKTQEVIIDPWVVSPSFNSSTAVWEVETDGLGNVYTIGGETPMELKKYNSAGTLQWTYTTPWDTISVWLGTLATDVAGTSYITAGVSPEMERIDNGGGMVWHSNAAGGALGMSDEFWSITFNCDHTKLIVGGTNGPPLIGFDYYAAIYEIDMTNGGLLDSTTFAHVTIGGFGSFPEEVRSLTSTRNAKYVYVTHKQVGALTENLSACPQFQVPNSHDLSYKCENYLPESQNGGGLKAITANDYYFYTHTGSQIHRWNPGDGSLINSVTLPGGNSTIGGLGGIVVSNSGLDVDSCGNVYAGSINTVVKFDSALNVISQANVSFTVYDVSVNANGEVVAAGAQNPNNNANRNGRIESVNLNACAQYTLICCNANVCPTGPLCISDPSVTLISSTSGGIWSGPGIVNTSTGEFDPAVAGAGIWTIVYTLSCGSDSLTIEVTTCAPMTVCLESNGDLTVSGGTGPYTWQEEVTTQDCSACLPPGNCTGFPPGCEVTITTWNTYATTVTATPPGTFPIQVYENPLNPLVITTLSGIPACSGCSMSSTVAGTNETCLGNNGTATATTTGGTTPYTYSWNTSPIQTGQVATGLAAGTYSVLITDATGCNETLSVTISTTSSSLAATATASNAQCNGACDGAATATPSSGTSPYTYLWDVSAGSQTTQTATGLCTGTFSVTITDADGCTVNTSTVVNEPAALTITMDSTAVSCNGASDGSATATPGGGASPYQYNWSNGQLTSSAAGLSAATYSITITDNNGCSQTASVTVDEPNGMGPTISATDASCGAADGLATVTLTGGTGPFTYLWSNGQTTSSDTGLVAGVYTVTITDASGCSESQATVINTIGGPTLTASSTDITCNGANDGTGSITATGGNPPYIYLWSDPSAQTNNVATGLDAGTFTVSVTDTSGCTSISSVTIQEPLLLVISLVSAPASCGFADGSASASVSGGSGPYTYSWSPSGGTDSIELNLAAGTYALSVTDSIGCSVVGGVIVASAGGPTTSISNSTDVLCFSSNDGTATVSATGGTAPLTYSWSPSGGTDSTATGLGPGSYTATVTDAGGCVSTSTVFISSPPDILLSLNATMISCFGSADGSVSVSAAGGIGPYSYAWSPTSDSTATATNLTVGNYSIVVTDANGCTSADAVNITEPTALVLSLSSLPAACATSDGSAIVSVSGGSGLYTYSWVPSGITNDTLSNIPAGVYTVSITDGNACTVLDSVIVNNTGGHTAMLLSSANVLCAGDANGTANVGVTGGTLPYTYSWSSSPAQTDSSATGLSAGNYNCTVTDAAGCIAIVPVTITEPTPLTVTSTPDSSVCPGATVTFSVSTSGGTPTYTFTWDNGLGNDSVHTETITQDITYTVIVVDANLCASTPETISFSIGSPVGISIQGAGTPTCPNQTTILTAAGLGGTPAYTFDWDNGDVGPVISVSPSTTTVYNVTVTDACGTTADTSITVIINPNLVLNPPTDTICPGETTTIEATGAIFYWWLEDVTLDTIDTTPSITISPLITTNYIITAGDGACPNVTDTAVVVVLNGLTAAFMVDPEIATIFEPTFQFTDLSLGDPVSWSWDFGDGSTDTIQHPNYTYADTGDYLVLLTVTDINSCKDSVYFTVQVKEVYSLFAPNSFSPNGDGVNDYFFPQGIGIQEETFEFYIFNRWGDLIFISKGEFGKYETTAAQLGWDGKGNHGNNVAQNEVYIWMIKTTDPDQARHQYVGHVTLIR